MRVSKTLHFEPSGKLWRVVGAVVDIHELRDGLLAEQRARDAAQESVAIVAHDLGNPLSAISASSLQLLRTESDPKLVRLATRIQTSARSAWCACWSSCWT